MAKRQRSKNFTEIEKRQLIDLVLPFKSIIENIKTDAVWNKKKNETWFKITETFNMSQTSGLRSVNQIKSLYDSLKRMDRKEKNGIKVELFKTGSGTKNSKLTNTTQTVIGLLGDRLDAVYHDIDCDDDYNNGLVVLNKKRVENTEKTKQVTDELYEVKLKKERLKLETVELEKSLMVKRMKNEINRMESEIRQNQIKEEILLLELKHKKKILDMG